MQTDYLQYIFQAINNLLTQNLGFFDAMGQNPTSNGFITGRISRAIVMWYSVLKPTATTPVPAYSPRVPSPQAKGTSP